MDENQTPTTSTQSGIKKEFPILLNSFKEDKFNTCSRIAIKIPGVILMNNPQTTCKGCALYGKQPGRKAFTIHIEDDNQNLNCSQL